MTDPNRKSNKKTNVTKKIDWFLIITLIIVVLYAVYNGHYQDVKIIEVCQGIPTNDNYSLIWSNKTW